jgi:hypothetical protein
LGRLIQSPLSLRSQLPVTTIHAYRHESIAISPAT